MLCRSVLAQAWKRLQGSLPLTGSVASAADFGAEVGMSPELGLALNWRDFSMKGA